MRLSAVLRPLRVGSERRAVERCAVERRAVERVDRCAVPAGGGASHTLCSRTLRRPRCGTLRRGRRTLCAVERCSSRRTCETLRIEGGAAGQIPLVNCPPCC